MNAIEVLIGELLGGAAKLALSLDQGHQQRLARLEGRSLRVHCTNPPQRLTLRVAAGELVVLPGSENPTDVTVSGTLTDLIALLRGGSPGNALRVNGDPTVLRDFSRLFEQYEPDWSTLSPNALRAANSSGSRPEEALFEQVRGLAEVGLASLGKALDTALRSGQEQARHTTHEYFAEDVEAAKSAERLRQLQSAITALGERIDQLDATTNKKP